METSKLMGSNIINPLIILFGIAGVIAVTILSPYIGIKIVLLDIFLSLSFIFLYAVSNKRGFCVGLLFFLLPIMMRIKLNGYYVQHIGGAPIMPHLLIADVAFITLLFFSGLGSYKKKRINYFDAIVLMYFLWSAISMVWALNKEASFYELFRLVKCILLYIYFKHNFNFDTDRKYLFYGLSASALFQVMIMCLQLFKNGYLGLDFLGESVNTFREGTEGFSRGASGTLGHPGRMGLFLFFCSLFFFSNYLISRKQSTLNVIILFVGMGGVFLSSSRTSWIILVVCLFLFFIITFNKDLVNKYLKLSYILMLIIIPAGPIIAQNFITRVIEGDTFTQYNNRFDHYRLAWQFITKNMFRGYGINNYIDVVRRFYPGDLDFIHVNPVHNVFLLYWVEIGLVGLVLYLSLFFFSFTGYIKVRGLLGSEQRCFTLGLLLSLLGIFIYNFTGWSGIFDTFVYIVWIYFGLIQNLVTGSKLENQDRQVVKICV